MRRHLHASVVLALLATAFGGGSGGELVPTVTPEEPTAVPPPRDQGAGPTAPPTISPPVGAKTATGVAPTRDASRVFLIYGLAHASETPLAGTRSPDEYREDVIEAVTADLAGRIEVSVDAISVVTSGYAEVQVASPCGSATVREETGAVGGGLVLGLEVVLATHGTPYRYVVTGGLGYFCEGG
jgi:hypothetical protein